MVIYTDFMPARFDGYNLGLVTLIRPRCRDDKGLHAHEAVHRAQFKRNPLMGLLYLFSKSHRLAYEVEAYRAQLKIDTDKAYVFAGYLAFKYGLTVSVFDAWHLLTNQTPNEPQR